ncbi:methyltransferase [Anaplasma marginale]|uniref:O-methyltransferase n=1 Tax=Anaplasma marginale TaxID=770 RepID=UPI000E58B354|nr:O-methyltransferase [Anaplasma marginale]AXW84896.1 methyltransferase [Anaplasma marginale]
MRSVLSNERLEQYCREVFGIDDGDALSVHASAPDGLVRAQVGFVEGRLLQFLVQATGTRSIVEVGTCVGFSAICMARALPPEGHVYTIEKDDQNCAKARQNIEKCGMTDKITVLFGDALHVLKNLEHKSPFDMMFIDANKSGYCDYLNWAEANIKRGGLLVADNVFLFGTVFDDAPSGRVSSSAHTSMQNFNKRLSNKQDYLASVIPTKEGMLVALKLR